MTASLDGPRANIERAKRHVREFEAIVNALVISKTTHPDAISIEDDAETTNLLYKLVYVPPVPDAVALVAGDAIHRLRSALDLLMTQLVERVDKGTHGRHTPYFPFDRTREGFEARLTPEVERLIGPDALDCLRAAEAYLGGKGEVAWYLHRLDVEDKHRIVYALGLNLSSLTLAAPVRQPHEFEGLDPAHVDEFNRRVGMMMDTIFWKPADSLFPLKEGDVLFSGPREPTNDPKFRLDVAFAQPEFVQAQPGLPTLVQYGEAAEALIESFAPLF